MTEQQIDALIRYIDERAAYEAALRDDDEASPDAVREAEKNLRAALSASPPQD